MSRNVARRPRFRRASDFSAVRLTDRDKTILSAVSCYRFLTTSHILSLVSGSRQNVVRRLQRLYHAGFLERPWAQLLLRFTGELSEMVYSPTRKTISPLAAFSGKTVSGKDSRSVSSLFLAHALAVSDALICIEFTCHKEGTTFVAGRRILEAISGGKTLRQLQWQVALKSRTSREKIGVIPDAVFAVDQHEASGGPRRFYFFLEVDRGTMPIKRKNLRLSSIHRKALAYLRTRRSGILKRKFGIPGFQVLFVTRSKERLERMKEACRAVARGKNPSLFLFTTSDELKIRSVWYNNI